MKLFYISFCCIVMPPAHTISFDEYVDIYNKNYLTNSDEYFTRYYAFRANLDQARSFNLNRTSKASALYGATEFSDLSAEEFEKTYLSSYRELQQPTSEALYYASHAKPLKSTNIPNKMDWAFAAVETVESMHAIKTGNRSELSVQQLIDCSNDEKSLSGCAGGGTCLAFQWMTDRHTALVSATDYPFVDKTQKCKLKPKVRPGVSINNFTCDNFKNAEHLMLVALVRGPLTVGVDATNWQNYQGGIIQYHCGTTNNHAVQIIGYDISGEIPYFIVRNSWGTGFGHDGYVYIKYGENVCGLAQQVSTVSVL